MAKNTHPLELAFMKFDDTTKRYLKQVSSRFQNIDGIPEVQQPKKRSKKSIYNYGLNTPFGRS